MSLDDSVTFLPGPHRWECYHVGEHEQGQVFYFKRRTSNAVAYLTNLLRAGALAF